MALRISFGGRKPDTRAKHTLDSDVARSVPGDIELALLLERAFSVSPYTPNLVLGKVGDENLIVILKRHMRVRRIALGNGEIDGDGLSEASGIVGVSANESNTRRTVLYEELAILVSILGQAGVFQARKYSRYNL